MLKEKVTELMERYESDGNMLACDVKDEIEFILDSVPYDGSEINLEIGLRQALRDYVIAQYDAERYGGRIPDGGDDFIFEVERIIKFC